VRVRVFLLCDLWRVRLTPAPSENIRSVVNLSQKRTNKGRRTSAGDLSVVFLRTEYTKDSSSSKGVSDLTSGDPWFWLQRFTWRAQKTGGEIRLFRFHGLCRCEHHRRPSPS